MKQCELIMNTEDHFNGQYCYFIKEIQQSQIEKRPAVYRWWFDDIPIPDEALKNTINKGSILKAIVEDKTFYALYVGKATSAYKRLYCHLPNEHRTGFKTSTLRRTLRALLCRPEQTIQECAMIVDDYMIRHAIIEWRYFDSEKSSKNFETECISNGYYPLNNSENAKLSAWTRQLTLLRKNYH